MKILNYMQPETREEAYEFIQHGGTVIGGSAWLKLQPKAIENAIDIQNLNLDQIEDFGDSLRIGSMVTLRELELAPMVKSYLDGFISEAAGKIMGVTVRNIATVGGTVASAFGFSDLLPALLAADAQLEWHHQGPMSLQSYLEEGAKEKDLLIAVILNKKLGHGSFKTFKKTSIDFPVVNAAVVLSDDQYTVVVGSRPGKAVMAKNTMALLNEGKGLDAAIEAFTEEITFGSNSRGSEAYRKEVAKALIERCVKEVMV